MDADERKRIELHAFQYANRRPKSRGHWPVLFRIPGRDGAGDRHLFLEWDGLHWTTRWFEDAVVLDPDP